MPGLRMHQLEGFFHVARLGSYTKAAQAFSYPIGQPAVYQQVKGLQEDLGITLVRQAGPRRTELTPEGRALYAFLAPFFDGLPKVLERITAAAAEPLTLAADQFLAMEALPPALLKARAAFPDFQLRLQERASNDVIQCVASGEADAGLVHLIDEPVGLNWVPLGRIGAALMVPRSHPLSKGGAPTTVEIAQHPLIVYESNSPGRTLLERLYRESGKRLLVSAEVTFSQTMRALVQSGLAPAFVPFLISGARGAAARSSLPREPQCVTYDMCSKLKGGALSFGLLHRPGMDESLALRVLLKALKDVWA